MGDAAQDLAGWQLQSDPVEGEPFDLGQAGALDAGQKVFVFQGHLSPPQDPALGFYRWGTGDIYYLRANDSSDYVRIVDAQGNTVDQRNCEGLPPGATPAPPSEFDPPPLATPVVETPAPAAPAPAAPGSTAAPNLSAPTRTPTGGARAPTPVATGAGGTLPAGGGPPGANQDASATLLLVTGASALAMGMLFVTLGLRRNKPGP